MEDDRILSIPPEILLEIGRLARAPDLATLLLANKWLNEFLSSLLYSSVTLKSPSSTQKWLRTLSTPQDNLFSARDLAHLVRSLNVSNIWPNVRMSAHPQEDEIRAGVTQVLPRLIYLRHLCFKTAKVLASEVLLDFLRLSQGNISSLDVVLARHREDLVPSLDVQHFDPVLRPHDNLTILKITGVSGSLAPACTRFLQRLLATCSDHIDTLSLLVSEDGLVSNIVHTISCFPNLTNLDFDVNAFFLPEFPHMAFPRVQALTLHGDDLWGNGLIPSLAYPLLGRISCKEQSLHVFFPNDVSPPQRRPIHTVQLRSAVYEVDGSWDLDGGVWSVVRNSLTSLRYSGTPVRHLSFDADAIDLAQLVSLSELLTSLETLIILTFDDLKLDDDSFDQMLANMPRLHSLLISDAPKRADEKLELPPITRSRTKQRKIVDRWGQHFVSLRRIAFTIAMEWVRDAEGWELKGHLGEVEIMTESDSDSDDSEDSDTGYISADDNFEHSSSEDDVSEDDSGGADMGDDLEDDGFEGSYF